MANCNEGGAQSSLEQSHSIKMWVLGPTTLKSPQIIESGVESTWIRVERRGKKMKKQETNER